MEKVEENKNNQMEFDQEDNQAAFDAQVGLQDDELLTMQKRKSMPKVCIEEDCSDDDCDNNIENNLKNLPTKKSSFKVKVEINDVSSFNIYLLTYLFIVVWKP